MLEAAIFFHACIERVLPGVAERRMAQVVRQCNGFDQIFVQIQDARDGAADLRHFEAMRQTRAKQVAFVIHEYLSLVFQTPKRAGMNDAVAVALEFAARRGGRFSVLTSARVGTMRRVNSQFSAAGHNA